MLAATAQRRVVIICLPPSIAITVNKLYLGTPPESTCPSRPVRPTTPLTLSFCIASCASTAYRMPIHPNAYRPNCVEVPSPNRTEFLWPSYITRLNRNGGERPAHYADAVCMACVYVCMYNRPAHTRMESYAHQARNAAYLGRVGRGELVGVLLDPGRHVHLGLGSLESAGQAVLAGDTLNTVGGVDVLDQRDLEASRATLARGDGGGGQEVLPDLFVRNCQRPELIPGVLCRLFNLRGTSGCRTWQRPYPCWPASFCTTATGWQSSGHQ